MRRRPSPINLCVQKKVFASYVFIFLPTNILFGVVRAHKALRSLFLHGTAPYHLLDALDVLRPLLCRRESLQEVSDLLLRSCDEV